MEKLTRPKEDLTQPKDWLTSLDDAPVTVEHNEELHHPDDPDYDEHVQDLYTRRVATHHVVASLAELRRALGVSQVEAAVEWGRAQPQVSRLERDPHRAELATLLTYIQALGGHLAVEASVDGHTYRYELA